VAVDRSEGLLLEAQPLRAAEEICRRLIDGVGVADGVLHLATDPAWAEAINTVLVKKGVRANELRQVGEAASSDTHEVSTLGVSYPSVNPSGGCTDRLSQRMRELAEKVWSFGNEFASQLHQIDAGLRVIIERAPGEVRENPQSMTEVCTFFESIRELSAAAREGLGAIQSMIDTISLVEAMSRDLRDPFRRLRQGLTLMVEAREVADEWVELIEDTGIDFDGVVSTPPP